MKILLIILSFGLFTFTAQGAGDKCLKAFVSKYSPKHFVKRFFNLREVIEYPGGRKVIKYSNGQRVTEYPDGSVKIGFTEYSDGRKVTGKKRAKAIKTRVLYGMRHELTPTFGGGDSYVIETPAPRVWFELPPMPGDAKVTVHPDGREVTEWRYNKLKVTVHPDGREVTEHPGLYKQNLGSWKVKEHPGVYKLTEHPDGERVTEYPGGRVVKEYSNGRVVTELPGTGKVTVHPDGRKVTEYLDGERVTRYLDGSMVTEYPDGSVVTEYSNRHKVWQRPSWKKFLFNSIGHHQN